MKIREGFVSNSSSSSFLAVGYDIKEKELENKFDLNTLEADILYAWLNKSENVEEMSQEMFSKPYNELEPHEKLETMREVKYAEYDQFEDSLIGNNDEDGAPRGSFFIGRRLVVFSEETEALEVSTFTELDISLKKYKDAAEKAGLDLSNKEPVLLVGTMLT